MQLNNLVKSIHEMSDEELEEKVREIRHRRNVIRPAKKNHEKRAEVKEVRADKKATVKGIEKMFANMTPAQKAQLILELQGAGNE